MRCKVFIPEDRLKEFCKRNHIRRLAVFGSALRMDFNPESDVDVLVEFEPDQVIGLKIVRIERELSDILRRKVDLRTLEELSPYFRDEVIREAEDHYVRS